MMAQLQGISQFVHTIEVPAASAEPNSAITENFAAVLDRVTASSGQGDETQSGTSGTSSPSAVIAKTQTATPIDLSLPSPGPTGAHPTRHGLPLRPLTNSNHTAVQSGDGSVTPESTTADLDGTSSSAPSIAVDALNPDLSKEAKSPPDLTQGVQIADPQGCGAGATISNLVVADLPPGRIMTASPVSSSSDVQAAGAAKVGTTTKGAASQGLKSEPAQSAAAQSLDISGSATLNPTPSDLPPIQALKTPLILVAKDTEVLSSTTNRLRPNGPIISPLSGSSGTAFSLPSMASARVSQSGLSQETTAGVALMPGARSVTRHESEDSNSVTAIIDPTGLTAVGGAGILTFEPNGLNLTAHTSGLTAQSVGTHPLASEVQVPQASSLEPIGLSSTTQSTNTDLQLMTLRSTPTSLEVGVSNGAHGWLKVRAEMTAGGVSASLTGASSAAAIGLRSQLPALASFLQSEKVPVTSLVVMTAITPEVQTERHLLPGFNQGVDLGQAGLAAGTDGGRDGAHGQSDAERGATASSAGAETTKAGPRAVASFLGYAQQQGLDDSSVGSSVVYGSGGSWLNVRV